MSLRSPRRSGLPSPWRVLLVVGLAGLAGACRALTESPHERYCQQLDAFPVDTAQMRTGQTRQFEAAGFQEGGAGGTSCLGTIRGGFHYSADVPEVATVGATTGLVTAHAVGSTPLRAVWQVNGITYRGVLTLHVLP